MSRLEKKLIIETSQNEEGFFIIYHKKLIDELNGKVLLEGNIEDFLYEENIDSKIDGYLSALNDLGYDVTTREVTKLNDKKEEGKKPLGKIKELERENLELKMENSKLKDSNSELATLIDQLEDEYASIRDMYFWIWCLLLIDYSRLYKLESFYFTTKKKQPRAQVVILLYFF